jgi:HEPN domain-containing protein
MNRQTAAWVRKANADWEGARGLAARKPPLRDLACFHCQQSAEKYLKGLLQEIGAVVPRTHDLESLLDLLLPHDRTLAPLRRILQSLTKFAVDYRYPGKGATKRGMDAAIRHAERVRREARTRLGLPP